MVLSPMSKIADMKSKLKAANEILEEVKEYTEAAVEVAHALLKEEDVHGLQELALNASMRVGTIESNLSEFSRIATHSKKFAAKAD